MAQKNQVSNDTRTLLTALVLLFAYPFGLILMWAWSKWTTMVKILITLPLIFLIVFSLFLFG